jgi:RimJ/RimL family protein N-acetyltransferase
VADAPADLVLESDRLWMRPLAVVDLDVLHGMFSDPEVMRFSPTVRRDRDQTRDWLMACIDRYRAHGHGFLALIHKEQGCYVGHAGLLTQEVDGQPEMEVGYWLRRRFWGRGFATEAACALRDHARDVYRRRRLVSLIVPENRASRRVAERVGMTVEKETVWKEMQVCVYSMELAPALGAS